MHLAGGPVSLDDVADDHASGPAGVTPASIASPNSKLGWRCSRRPSSGSARCSISGYVSRLCRGPCRSGVLVDEVDASSSSRSAEDVASVGPRRRSGGPRRTRRTGRRARRGVVEVVGRQHDRLAGPRSARRSSSISHCCVRGSSAAVGSSNSSTSGFITSTDAIATRFFWPPDSWYGARSARSAMSSIASVSSTRAVDLVVRQAHVQRAERDLLAHGRREHLGVGVLEDEADPDAEASVRTARPRGRPR